jgi:hypothetical protein
LALIVLDGELGEDGRRKGDVRGDPKERGDGLYGELGFIYTMLFDVLRNFGGHGHAERESYFEQADCGMKQLVPALTLHDVFDL